MWKDVSVRSEPEKLPGLFMGLFRSFEKPLGSSERSLRLRQEALEISLRLWNTETGKATAINLLDWWDVTDGDVSDTQQMLLSEVIRNVTSSTGNWRDDGTSSSILLTRFPQIAQEIGVTPDVVIDDFAQKRLFHIAIKVAERCGRTEKMEPLQQQARLEKLEVAAHFEGKDWFFFQRCHVLLCSICSTMAAYEVKGLNQSNSPKSACQEHAAIQMCERSKSLRKLLVQKLLKQGKLRLAEERINAWKLPEAPSKEDQQRGQRQSGLGWLELLSTNSVLVRSQSTLQCSMKRSHSLGKQVIIQKG